MPRVARAGLRPRKSWAMQKSQKYMRRLKTLASTAVYPMTSRKATVWVLAFCALALLTFAYSRKHHVWLYIVDVREHWIALGFRGYLLAALIVLVANFPPIPGYSSTITLCGFLFGFPGGFFPAWLGALAGASLCFAGAREAQRRQVIDLRRFITKIVAFLSIEEKDESDSDGNGSEIDEYDDGLPLTSPQAHSRPEFAAHTIAAENAERTLMRIERAVENGGIKFLILLRLAPYPWALSNVLLSQLKFLQLRQFAIATGVALFKLLLYIWVGAELARGNEAKSYLSIAAGAGVGVAVTIYVLANVRAELRKTDTKNAAPSNPQVDARPDDLNTVIHNNLTTTVINGDETQLQGSRPGSARSLHMHNGSAPLSAEVRKRGILVGVSENASALHPIELRNAFPMPQTQPSSPTF